MSASSATTTISKIAPVSITVDHPRLLETNDKSIRGFLGKYNQYSNTVLSCSRQVVSGTSTTQSERAVDLKFRVDVDFLESTIVLGFIPDAASCNALTNTQVRAFLEGRAKEAKDVVMLDMFDT